MSIRKAASDAYAALRREPKLIPLLAAVTFVPAFLLEELVLASFRPDVVGVVPVLLLAPFLLGGAYGVLDDVIDGDPLDFERFLTSGVENYLSLVGVWLIIAVAGVATSLLRAVQSAGDVVSLLLLPAYLFALLAFQFVYVKVVVHDESAVSTFRASYDVFSENRLNVLLYILLRGCIVLAFLVPAAVLYVLATAPLMMVGLAATLGQLLALGVASLAGVVLLPLHVAYVKEITFEWQPSSRPIAASTSSTDAGSEKAG